MYSIVHYFILKNENLTILYEKADLHVISDPDADVKYITGLFTN